MKLIRSTIEDVLNPTKTSPNNIGAEHPHPIIIPPINGSIVPMEIPEYRYLLFIVVYIEYIETVINIADTTDNKYIMYIGTFNSNMPLL